MLIDGKRVVGFDVRHERVLSAAGAEDMAPLDPDRSLVRDEAEAFEAAARELVAIGEAETLREGEITAQRVARETLAQLAPGDG